MLMGFPSTAILIAVLRAASTPTFIIGGMMLTGAQPIENFRSAIDSALARPGKTTP